MVQITVINMILTNLLLLPLLENNVINNINNINIPPPSRTHVERRAVCLMEEHLHLHRHPPPSPSSIK